MKKKELLYWIWVSLAMGPGGKGFDTLINAFGRPDEIFFSEDFDVSRFDGVSRSALTALSQKDLSRAIEILDLCEKRGISILTYSDDRYPDTLRGINDAPPILYYRGTLPDMNGRMCIAMVGTRSMSECGMDSAYQLAYGVAKANAIVVSGMASGVDGVCSAAAIAANGETVAVLGSGIDVVYPREHKKLYEEICRHGAVVSEYPPGTKPLGYHFPMRNRLISGISQATVVVETRKGSGSLITAERALEQGRRVYALSSSATGENAIGMRTLLEKGAKALISAENIIADYAHIYPKTLRTFRAADITDVQTDLAYLERLDVISSDEQEKTTSRTRRFGGALFGRKSTNPCSEKQQPKPHSKGTTLPTEEELSSMPPIEAAILRCFRKDTAISTEFFYTLPYSANEISVALTCLEISGRIKKTPGSLYERC